MSLAVLAKKSKHYTNRVSGCGHNGFSLNGGYRNQGWVGQDMLGRTLIGTKFRGTEPLGHGGSNGKYTTTIINTCRPSTNHPGIIKRSNMNTAGYISSRLVPRGAPCEEGVHTRCGPIWVQKFDPDDHAQSEYIRRLGTLVASTNWPKSGGTEEPYAATAGPNTCEGVPCRAASYFIGTRKVYRAVFSKSLPEFPLTCGEYTKTRLMIVRHLPTPPCAVPWPPPMARDAQCKGVYVTPQEGYRAGLLPKEWTNGGRTKLLGWNTKAPVSIGESTREWARSLFGASDDCGPSDNCWTCDDGPPCTQCGDKTTGCGFPKNICELRSCSEWTCDKTTQVCSPCGTWGSKCGTSKNACGAQCAELKYQCNRNTGSCEVNTTEGMPLDICNMNCKQSLYKCEGGQCVSSATGHPLATCQNTCAAPAPTYNCKHGTGCQKAPAGTTGQYSDIGACQSACNGRADCIHKVCTPILGGTYTSMQACRDAGCQPPATKYTCDPASSQCKEDPHGQYSSPEACSAACHPPGYSCRSGGCVKDANGHYTEPQCEASCVYWRCTPRGCEQRAGQPPPGAYHDAHSCHTACNNWECRPSQGTCTQLHRYTGMSKVGCETSCTRPHPPPHPPPHPHPHPHPHPPPQQRYRDPPAPRRCPRVGMIKNNDIYYKPGSGNSVGVGGSCNPGTIGARSRRLGGKLKPIPTVIFRNVPKT